MAWRQSVPPSGELLTIFCVDFNHEVAPPLDWEAIIRPLDSSHAGSFQYGTTANAFMRYESAAWLFQSIETLQGTKLPDANLETEYQVATWKLFVDPSHSSLLDSKITASGPQFAADVTVLYNQALLAPNTWAPDSNWFVATTDPAWMALHQPGVPVQEFLIHREPPPVPEPAAVLLLATVVVLLGLRLRWHRPA
jgi:hypothetical protein